MPSYDLSCPVCSATFEVFRQGFLNEDDRTCPECGAQAEQQFTEFVTSRPRRVATRIPSPAPVTGGHGCGGHCGCGGH